MPLLYNKYLRLKRSKDMIFYITKSKKQIDKNYDRLKQQFSLNDKQINQIKTYEKPQEKSIHRSTLMYDENKTLAQYCKEHEYNYDVIYKKIVEHGL